MERKKALVTAGAVSGTLFAASTALALSGGLVDLRADDGAGTLAPVTTVGGGAGTVSPATVPDPAAVEAAPPAPAVVRPSAPPVTRSEASSVRGDDDRGGSDEHEEHDDGDEGEDRTEAEYEGADDDD